MSTKLVLRNTFLLQLLIAVGTLTPWIEADHTPSPEVFWAINIRLFNQLFLAWPPILRLLTFLLLRCFCGLNPLLWRWGNKRLRLLCYVALGRCEVIVPITVYVAGLFGTWDASWLNLLALVLCCFYLRSLFVRFFISIFDFNFLFFLLEVFINAHSKSCLSDSEGHQTYWVNIEAVLLQFEELFFSNLIPEFIKELVIVFLSQRGLYDRVEILLWLYSLHTFTSRTHLNIDEFLSGLQRPCELKVEAPRH